MISRFQNYFAAGSIGAQHLTRRGPQGQRSGRGARKAGREAREDDPGGEGQVEGEAGEETDEEERREDHHETMMLCPGLREAAFFSSFSYCYNLMAPAAATFHFYF